MADPVIEAQTALSIDTLYVRDYGSHGYLLFPKPPLVKING